MRSTIELIHSPEPHECLAGLAAVRSANFATDAEKRAVIECLGSGVKAIQRRAAELIVHLNPASGPSRNDVLDDLEARLSTEQSATGRWGLVYCLAALGSLPSAALPVCLEQIGSPDSDLRWSAVAILKKMASCPDVAKSLVHLATMGTAGQRKMALYALRDIGLAGVAAESAAISRLRDSDPGVQLAALSALPVCCVDPEKVLAAIEATFAESDVKIRRAALIAIGAVPGGGATAEEILRRALSNDDESIRRVASRFLASRIAPAKFPT